MKKIFAIFLGLLLLGTVFGVASVASAPNGSCKYQIIGPTSVQVGDTFQVKVMKNGCCTSGPIEVKGALELLCVTSECEKYEEIPGGILFTYKALKVGTYEKLYSIGCSPDETIYYGVTVTPREYPMLSFMKLLGLGKKD